MGTSPRIGLKKYPEIRIFLLRMKDFKSLEYGDSNLSLFDKKKVNRFAAAYWNLNVAYSFLPDMAERILCKKQRLITHSGF